MGSFFLNSIVFIPNPAKCRNDDTFILFLSQNRDGTEMLYIEFFGSILFEHLEQNYADFIQRIEDNYFEKEDIETLKQALKEMDGKL